MNNPLKIAVIGTGAFGELHARTLHLLPEIQLTALVDSKKAKASLLANVLGGVPVFSSLREVIAQNKAEATVIATRTDTHIPLAREAVAAGLHVLIEKPVAGSSHEISELAKFCKNSPVTVMAGHICLFHSLTAPLMAKVRTRGFRAINFVRHRPAQTAVDFAEEHPIRMTMIHDLYVLAGITGEDEPAHYDGLEKTNTDGMPDMTWATLRWDDGRVATLQSHWTLPPGSPQGGLDHTEVFGRNYYTRIETNPQNSLWVEDTMSWPHGLEISLINGHPAGMLAEELRAFASACRGEPVPEGARLVDAARVQKWVERLIESAMQKQCMRKSHP